MAAQAARKTIGAGQSGGLGLSLTLPTMPTMPTMASVTTTLSPAPAEPGLMTVGPGMMSADIASAPPPESRKAVMNSKIAELAKAKEVLSAQTASVKVAQDSISYWNTQLLSSNSAVRESAWQKVMTQLMQIKRLLPDMAAQEQTIMRLEKGVAAERMLMDSWPAQAGLVGGAALPRFAGYAPRFLANPRQRFF